MCGRFTQRHPAKVLREKFGAEAPEVQPRFNVAPAQQVLAVREVLAGREASFLKWGLIPSWAKDPAVGNKLINARSETVAEKPSFRDAFKLRRCLIAADGFYEWKRVGSSKQPYYFQMNDGEPFAFAGLWERWEDMAGEPIETCTILTTGANEVLRPVHDRMPVILPPEAYDLWLNTGVGKLGELLPLLRPYPAGEMTSRAVSTLVNSPSNSDPRCVEPLTDADVRVEDGAGGA